MPNWISIHIGIGRAQSYQLLEKCSIEVCKIDYIHFSVGRICLIRSSLVFVVKEVFIDALAEKTEQISQMTTDSFTCVMLDLRKAFGSKNIESL